MLKAKVQSNGTSVCPPCPNCDDRASAADIAHMAETTKIDMYISQSEGELAATPPEERVKEPAKATKEKAEPKKAVNATEKVEIVKPIHLSKTTLKMANTAVAGQGAIGRYLRGEQSKDSPPPPPPAFNSTGAATGNAGIEQALETIAQNPAKDEETDDGDDLARRLLLQAEHNLKLAS